MTETIFMWVVVIFLGLIFVCLYFIGTYMGAIQNTLFAINENLVEANEARGWPSFPRL